MPDLTQTEVEEWLDAHPEECLSYFLRKAELSAINAWLVTHGLPKINYFVPLDNQETDPFANSFRRAVARFLSAEPTPSNLTALQLLLGDDHCRTNSIRSLRNDFAKSKSKSMFKTHEPFTPELSTCRKNSLKDMRKYSSLPPTSVDMLSSLIESKVKLPRGFPFHNKATKEDLRKSKGENEFFLSIVRDIATELDIRNLSVKAADNLTVLLNGEGASLFLIERQRGGPQILVSRVEVVRNSPDSSELPDAPEGAEGIKPSENAEPSEGDDGANGAEDIKPSENAEPSEGDDGANGAEDIKPSENAEPSESDDGANGAEGIKPSENAEPSEGDDGANGAEDIKPSENAEPSECDDGANGAEDIKPSENAEPSECDDGANGAEDIKPSENAEPSEGDDGANGAEDIKPSENAEPSEGDDGANGAEGIKPSENAEPSEGDDGANGAEGIKPSENAEPSECDDGANGANGAEGIKPSENAEPSEGDDGAIGAEGIKPSENAEPSEGDDGAIGAEGIKPSENAEPSESADGAEGGQRGDIHVPWGVGILGHVAETGDTVNLRVASEDPRFDRNVDSIAGFYTESLLCMPVKNAYDEIIAVVQVVNKNKSIDDGYFTESDVDVLGTYLQFIGIAITNAQIMEASRQEYERNRTLLEVVHNLFEQQTSLEKVMVKIMQRAQKLLECQKAAILLLEDTLENSAYARLFELAPNASRGDDRTPKEKERARAVTRYLVRVAERVVTSGQGLNIPEILDAEQGNEGVIKNLLAMPIRNSHCQIIGVASIIDKSNGLPFDDCDEQLFEAYTIFCGLGIHNTLMFSEVDKAMARQKVALEMLSYHTTASMKEVLGLMEEPVPCADDLNLYSLSFDDFSLEEDEMVKAAVSMFLQLDLVKKFSIEKNTLYRFLVSVKRNYRDVPYHNWRHAFNVSQVMFAILMGCEMKETFSDIEVFGMFVGCLCHDLDHRGTNNSFQQKSGSDLVLLYGTTNTMEHHHFNHAVMILSTECNNIFSNLTPEGYSKVMDILKDTILSTDLSVYFENRAKFFELVRTNTYSWDLDDHRELLRSMLMTACDLAASCKPWEVQKKVARLVTSEFFEQGDKERDELHLTPQPLMDRERRHELPQLQISWITDVCLPLYESLGEMNPKLSPMAEGAAENRRQWQRIVDEKNTMNWDTVDD